VTQHRHFKYFFNKNGLRQLKATPPPSGSSSSRGGGRAGAGHPCRQPSGSQSARDPASSGIRPSPPLCRYTKFGLHSTRLPRRASAVPTSPVRPQDPSSRAEVRPKEKLSRRALAQACTGAHHVPFRPTVPTRPPLRPPNSPASPSLCTSPCRCPSGTARICSSGSIRRPPRQPPPFRRLLRRRARCGRLHCAPCATPAPARAAALWAFRWPASYTSMNESWISRRGASSNSFKNSENAGPSSQAPRPSHATRVWVVWCWGVGRGVLGCSELAQHSAG
jgi:hypothetical protein